MSRTRVAKMSKLYAPTLKEDPAEAELASHKLMLRAGFIRKVASGLYSYLPLAWRSIRKIEDICRDEMDGIGAQEMLAPILTLSGALGRVWPYRRVRPRAHAATGSPRSHLLSWTHP